MADAAKTLLRTAVRTFFSNPKQILIVDALMLHSVLHIEDLAILLTSQPKDIRGLMNPLRQARLLSTGTREEVRAGQARPAKRDYYYTPFHPAIDAIKYRIAKMRRKVETLYQRDETKIKQLICPRCKSEYEELEVMTSIGDEGFICEKCGTTLVQNDVAVKDMGNHEQIRKLNTQLAKFDQLMHKIDSLEIPENDFLSAWERKKDVPRREGYHDRQAQYFEVKRDANKNRGPETVNTKNLAINLTSSTEQEKEEEAAREERKKKLAQQNQLPDWMAKSAIGPGGNAVKSEDLGGRLKEEERDEKKPIVSEFQDDIASYLADMERERIEREQKEKEEDAESDDGEDDEFEDVIGASAAGTPMSSQQEIKRETNGIKREYDADSGPSSSAGTPASTLERDTKRVKLENDTGGAAYSGNGTIQPEAESEEDDDEGFEDVI